MTKKGLQQYKIQYYSEKTIATYFVNYMCIAIYIISRLIDYLCAFYILYTLGQASIYYYVYSMWLYMYFVV